EPAESEPAAVDVLDTELVEEEFEVSDVSEESVESDPGTVDELDAELVEEELPSQSDTDQEEFSEDIDSLESSETSEPEPIETPQEEPFASESTSPDVSDDQQTSTLEDTSEVELESPEASIEQDTKDPMASAQPPMPEPIPNEFGIPEDDDWIIDEPSDDTTFAGSEDVIDLTQNFIDEGLSPDLLSEEQDEVEETEQEPVDLTHNFLPDVDDVSDSTDKPLTEDHEPAAVDE
ncbi:hypothetical protein VIBC2010_14644, partial [Vibrio caribbeanicus ATCC BAA-2122]